MFEQLKVGQNNPVNIIPLPERENLQIEGYSSGMDFYSMVMDRSGERAEVSSSRIDGDYLYGNGPVFDERAGSAGSRLTERNNESDRGEYQARPVNDKEAGISSQEKKLSTQSGNTDEKNSAAKSASSREDVDESNKGKRGGADFSKVSEFLDGTALKDFISFIKSVIAGDGKNEDESFGRLAKGVKSNILKGSVLTDGGNMSERKNNGLTLLTDTELKDIKELLKREILKNPLLRNSGKKIELSGGELKEAAYDIINSMKKGNRRAHQTGDFKAVQDDIKTEKKVQNPGDLNIVRKDESSGKFSQSKNSFGDHHQGRDNLNFNFSKTDQLSRTLSGKSEHINNVHNFRESLQEVIDNARISVKDGKNGSFTVKLNPKELGNINVNLVMENGIINGKFLVDNNDVKNLLLSNLNDLKYQLENAGISVGSFSVNVSDQGERFLRSENGELSDLNLVRRNDDEVSAAVEQYNSMGGTHSGHINMVI